jgi:hypothetical protein
MEFMGARIIPWARARVRERRAARVLLQEPPARSAASSLVREHFF